MSARWRYILQEAMIGLRRNLMMTVAVILSVTVSLALLGAGWLLREQVDLAQGEWTGRIQASIYLCDGRKCPEISQEQRQTLRTELEGEPIVAEVFYESKQQAYESFIELFRDQPDLVDTVTPDALPESFRVRLTDPALFSIIREKYSSWPGVEEVFDQQKIIDQFLNVARTFQNGALLVAAVQLGAALVLIANTIRVAAYARREQTSIMKLVGASNWYIRLPFLLEGIIAGLIGAAIAWGSLLAVVPWATSRLRESIEFVPFIGSEQTIAVGPLLILVSILIAGVSSFVALHRHLDV